MDTPALIIRLKGVPYACHDANKDAKSGKILGIFHYQVRAVTSLMLCKGLTAPALPAFPGRELFVQERGRTVPVVQTVHPCRV